MMRKHLRAQTAFEKWEVRYRRFLRNCRRLDAVRLSDVKRFIVGLEWKYHTSRAPSGPDGVDPPRAFSIAA